MSNNLAFIFARGGSKGVPGKNLKLLGGKPLIAHAIEAGLQARHVDRVVVSTDANDIAETAKAFGADVPFMRPDELAADTTPEWFAWRHAINTLRDLEGPAAVSSFISIPATSPLRNPDDIDRCIERLQQGDCDIVITVTEAARNPYFNMVTMADDGEAELVIKPASGVTRRQDAPAVFDITTVAYAAKPEFILKANGLFEGRVKAVEVPAIRALDIDTELDFEIAELLYKKTKGPDS